MKLQESGENYLETILILSQKNGMVRSIDIANELNFSKPSISRAMGILKNAGLITIEKSGQINLTEVGYEKATAIYERHCLIKEFLMQTLQIDEELADKDACRIEHVISEETFNKMKEMLIKE
ncbi:MAG: metal-dependent transcriptional regulator [Turicibacter sp.]|nr:metal-dependent transcriptional regulator [Turicibacter sp.]MBQ4164152.1 metal-dependent transcriptional regulator [Turicibacter sp.]